ncbi:MAG: hypothetical protein JJU28_19575 [Cyclobacteriaceae bacterium]|nr:hypothetical protein [Cyclobacteriaceae bacterium]
MKRIDFMGPSGVGKSYLLDHLKRERNRIRKDWLTETEALKLVPFKKLYYLPVTRSISRISEIEEKKAFKNCYKDWNNFFTVCRLGLNNYDSGSKNFYRSVSKLLKTSKKVRLLEKTINKKIIFDQSLSQKLFFIFGSNPKDIDSDLIKQYFFSMPKPKLLVVLTASNEVIYKRILKRRVEEGRGGVEYSGAKGEELINRINLFLEWTEIAIDTVKKNHGNVLVLNTAVGIEENCTKIINSIKCL